MLTVEHLGKTFVSGFGRRVKAVRDVSFHIKAGTTCACLTAIAAASCLTGRISHICGERRSKPCAVKCSLYFSTRNHRSTRR